jgi:hypothetical protein
MMGYRAGFIEHYILPVLYPAALTRQLQIGLGLFVIAVNLGIYGWRWRRLLKSNGTSRCEHRGRAD